MWTGWVHDRSIFFSLVKCFLLFLIRQSSSSAIENQETLAEIKKAHEREKALLREEVHKLNEERERVSLVSS